MTLNQIKSKYEVPLIGVIGASIPSEDYTPEIGKEVGYKLRDLIENTGTVFTGGVPGVGIDVYEGIIMYCDEQSVRDKFFCLLPEGEFRPPQSYYDLARVPPQGGLKIERVGEDTSERRTYLAHIADLLVMINGSEGTLDEALKGLVLGKDLYCLSSSGGAARLIAGIKEGKINKLPLDINYDLIHSCDSIDELIKKIQKSLEEFKGS